MNSTGKIKVFFGSSGLDPQGGGPAFSEATLVSELYSHCEVTVAVREDRYRADFAKEYDLQKVVTYHQTEVLGAWIQDKNPIRELVKNSDIVHLNGHWTMDNVVIGEMARQYHIPYLLHPRGMFLVGHRKVWMKRTFNRVFGFHLVRGAARIIALSPFETGQFKPYKVSPEKIAIIPNPIRSQSGRPPKKPKGLAYFLYLGRLEDRKNLLFLLDVFHDYRKLGGAAQLHFVGPVERGYGDKIQRRIRQLKLEPHVVVAGPKFGDEKTAVVRNAISVIYPAIEEAFGRVPFEALALGTPTLVPRHSGAADYMKAILPECIYDDKNRRALTRSMLLIEEQNSKEWRDKVARAKRWVDSELSPKAISDEVLALYYHVLGRKQKRRRAG